MKTVKTVRQGGYTMLEIMIVVAMIGFLAAIAVPQFAKARSYSYVNACIANMKQIDAAKATWAMENQKVPASVPAPTDLFGSDRYIRSEPKCPNNDSAYILTAVGTAQDCPNVLTFTDHKLP